MGNTDKFDMIANMYDTPERIHIAKVSSDAIRKYVGDAKDKKAIDFGCGTGLVGMNLINDFHSVLFLDTSENMIQQVEQKISAGNIRNAVVGRQSNIRTQTYSPYPLPEAGVRLSFFGCFQPLASNSPSLPAPKWRIPISL